MFFFYWVRPSCFSTILLNTFDFSVKVEIMKHFTPSLNTQAFGGMGFLFLGRLGSQASTEKKVLGRL